MEHGRHSNTHQLCRTSLESSPCRSPVGASSWRSIAKPLAKLLSVMTPKRRWARHPVGRTAGRGLVGSVNERHDEAPPAHSD